ncbi:S16 family serine protease [Actinoplanes missouriensis]|uniref:S16 family serine protease n=1 Tax=Actinoplanes missouriensis TaxID=1866 RepID=UPI0033C36576
MKNRGLLVAAGALVVSALAAGVWFAPLPYLTQQPGPPIDTLGGDVITISGADTSASTGRLLLTTIQVSDDVDVATAVRTWFDHTEALVPRTAVFPGGRDEEQVRQANQASFDTASRNAITAALSRSTHPTGVRVKVSLADIGGPSAGLMITLGIIDKLTPADLTGGQVIAGTGELAPDGAVGPIGGIPQKLTAAERAGARYFLVPADNCAEAVPVAPPGLTLARVATVDEALAALKAIAAGTPPGPC